MSAYFEIVELPSGEVVLRRTDMDEEPIMKIEFSKEALRTLGESKKDVAQAMIGTGIEIVGDIYNTLEQEAEPVIH